MTRAIYIVVLDGMLDGQITVHMAAAAAAEFQLRKFAMGRKPDMETRMYVRACVRTYAPGKMSG